MTTHNVTKRECKARLLYPHINWGRGGKSIGGCLKVFTGRETTLFCPRCSQQIYRLRARGDMGIKHPENPYNLPGLFKNCAWPKCNRTFIPNKMASNHQKYCSPRCRKLGSEAATAERRKLEKTEAVRVPNFKRPAYSRAKLQRLRGSKFAQTVSDILEGRAILA